MNPLATKLNEQIKGSLAEKMLSDYGKRLYVPQGIIVQSQEAKKYASKYMATIGIAMEKGIPMNINSIRKQFGDNLSEQEIFSYSQMGGNPNLRKKWLADMEEKNPLMKGKKTSLPIVTSGLTNCISLAASLFINKNDNVILPDMYWENYDLIFEEQVEANINHFPFFKNSSFNIEGLGKAIEEIQSEKIFLLLNFPNNPTGYTPTEIEMEKIAELLKEEANNGKKIVVFSDDAYFGLFFSENVAKQSLFAHICNCHENILAIKGDAATKEEMAWGFRVGFITYGSKSFTDETYHVLEQKTLGAIRGSISSCCTSSQNALLKGMDEPNYKTEKEKGIQMLKLKYDTLKHSLEKYKDRKDLIPLPFNSGYFMTFKCTYDAEKFREKLLLDYQTGIIRIDNNHIRLAFSSCDVEKIPGLIDTLYSCSSLLTL